MTPARSEHRPAKIEPKCSSPAAAQPATVRMAGAAAPGRNSRAALRWLLKGGLAACVMAQFAHSQDRAPATSGLDPKVEEVFAAMSARLAAAQQFSFESRAMIDRVLDSGLRVQYSRRSQVVARRPGAFAASAVGDVEDAAYWYLDGKLTMLDRRSDTYAQVDVPRTIDEMFDYMATRYGLVFPLCDLMFSDPRKACLERIHVGVYVGLHDVEGQRCHHLAFRQEGVDWQLWIAEGVDPLPRKVVITYKDLPDSPQFVALLDKWNLADQQPAKVFEFTPPGDAKRVELPRMDQPAKPESESPGGGQ